MDNLKNDVAMEIPIDNLSDELQTVAEAIGMDTMLQLIKLLGGMRIYFPKYETILRTTRDNHIRKVFTGSNHRELAKKFNLSESQIRSIIQTRQSQR